MKKALKQLQKTIGISLSIIILYIVLFRPQPGELFAGRMSLFQALFGTARIGVDDLVEAYGLLNAWPALLGMLLLAASLFIRAWRWRIIIGGVGRARYRTVFHCLNVGYMMNNLLPLRAGEFIRGVIVARRSNLSATSLLTTVIVERIFDLAGLAVFFGVVMVAFPFPGWLKISGATVSVGVVVFLIAGLIISSQEERLRRWHQTVTARGPKLSARLGARVLRLIEGLGVLKSVSAMFHMAWTTLLMWAMYITTTKLVLDAFQFTDGRFPLLEGTAWVQAGALTLITALGFAIPSAPGGIGTYHGAVLLGLSWFNVPQGLAVVYAATMHAVNYIILSAAGLIGLWRLKLRWSDLVHQSRRAADTHSNEMSESSNGD